MVAVTRLLVLPLPSLNSLSVLFFPNSVATPIIEFSSLDPALAAIRAAGWDGLVTIDG